MKKAKYPLWATYGFKGDSLTLGESKCDSFDLLLEHRFACDLDSLDLDTSRYCPQYDGVEGILLFAKAKSSKNFNMVALCAGFYFVWILRYAQYDEWSADSRLNRS